MWNFLDIEQILEYHDRLINNYGGTTGLLDKGRLEAAIMYPQNKLMYNDATVFHVATGYLFAIANNHPFVDGNKRTGWFACNLFLSLNDFEIVIHSQKIAEDKVVDLICKKITEYDFAEWMEGIWHGDWDDVIVDGMLADRGKYIK